MNLQSSCLKMTCSPHVMVVHSDWWIICIGGLQVMVHWRSHTKKINFITNLALINYSLLDTVISRLSTHFEPKLSVCT